MSNLAYHNKIAEYFSLFFTLAIKNVYNIYHTIIYPETNVIVAEKGGKRITKEVIVLREGRQPTVAEKEGIESILDTADSVIKKAKLKNPTAKQLAEDLERLADAYIAFKEIVADIKAEGRYIPSANHSLESPITDLSYKKPTDLVELMDTYAKFFRQTAKMIRDGRIDKLTTELTGSYHRAPEYYVKELRKKLHPDAEKQPKEKDRGSETSSPQKPKVPETVEKVLSEVA